MSEINYRVAVRRVEERETTINVSAMSASDAEQFALDQAGDVDFTEKRVEDVSYRVEFVERFEACDHCGEDVESCDCRKGKPHDCCDECNCRADSFGYLPNSNIQLCGSCMMQLMNQKATTNHG